MSLKYRITLAIFLLEVLMMVLVLSPTISRFDTSTREQLEETESVMMHLLAGAARTALLTEEYAEIQSYLNHVGEDSKVIRAILADHRGTIVASLDGADVGLTFPSMQTNGDRFWRTRPITNATGVVGSVAVEFSDAPVVAAAARIRWLAIAIALSGITVIAVASLFTGTLLTRKLERVSTAAHELAAGELGTRTGLAGDDEIGRLGRAFDSMAERLEMDREELRKAEDAVRASEQHYRSLVDNVPVSVHEIDLQGRMTAVSRAGLAMMGVDVESQALGRRYIEFVDAGERDNIQFLLSEAFRGETVEFDFTSSVSGAPRVFRSGFYPVLDEAESVMKLVGVTQDVTERKHAEEALKTSEEQLRQSQKIESIGLLAGGVAHDFNNILTIIGGYTELILAQRSSPDHDKIAQIATAARRAASLTRQLLAFSRRQVLQPRVLDLTAIVSDMKKMLERVIDEDIEMTTTHEHTLWPVKADPGQLEQVVMNLVLNARDAMPEGGHLALETSNVELTRPNAALEPMKAGSYVKLSVVDTGMGMTPEQVDRAFEPFYTTKHTGEGTGLGLSTVYGIVKQSEGFIFVRSDPGSGARFDLYFPRVTEDLSPAEIDSTKVQGGTETILVVEDDDAVRVLAKEVLSDNGYTVVTAEDGEMALRMLEQHDETVQLVISDVVMPIMSGPELAKEVCEKYSGIKVLFASGYIDAARRRALPPGTELLQKPFTPNGLLLKVAAVLGSQSQGVPM